MEGDDREKRTSKDYKTIQTEYKWFGFMKKSNSSVEFYNRSETSSKDGWWYTNTKSWEEGKWKIDWYPMGLLVFGVLFLFFVYLVTSFQNRIKSS